MNLILVDPADVAENGVTTLRGGPAGHVISVLKAVPGQTIRVGLLNGALGNATVTGISDRSVTLQCRFEQHAPARPRVDLLLALPRPKVLRRLWAQLAALGVGQVILTNASKVERDYFDAHIVTEEHYRPLLLEGLQQARDTLMPAVSVHRQFRVLVEDHLSSLFPRGRRLVAHPGNESGTTPLSTIGSADRVLLAVGPEGGWNEFELNLLAAHGFERFDMGGRILRTDTACIALLALVHSAIRQP